MDFKRGLWPRVRLYGRPSTSKLREEVLNQSSSRKMVRERDMRGNGGSWVCFSLASCTFAGALADVPRLTSFLDSLLVRSCSSASANLW